VLSAEKVPRFVICMLQCGNYAPELTVGAALAAIEHGSRLKPLLQELSAEKVPKVFY